MPGVGLREQGQGLPGQGLSPAGRLPGGRLGLGHQGAGGDSLGLGILDLIVHVGPGPRQVLEPGVRRALRKGWRGQSKHEAHQRSGEGSEVHRSCFEDGQPSGGCNCGAAPRLGPLYRRGCGAKSGRPARSSMPRW